MKIITVTARSVAAEWKKQNCPFDHWPFEDIERTRKVIHEELEDIERTRKVIHDELLQLDETASTSEINAVIGNEIWTRQYCVECGKAVDALIEFGQHGHGKHFRICARCLDEAVRLLSAEREKLPFRSDWADGMR